MIKKEREKSEAIRLRKDGLSYNEILGKVPVAKSTLSVWLRAIGIAKKQQQGLTQKRKFAQEKAQEACRNKRIAKEKEIIALSRKEIGRISKKDLQLIGTVLYWAEGSKQKLHNVSQRVSFGNSDPDMILLFIRWAKEICSCSYEDFVYSLYIHKTASHKNAIKHWEKLVNGKISWVYLKKHNFKTNRKNINKEYYGLLRVDIRKSTDLNRKIKGWTYGILDGLDISNGA
jgi:hypothetical protein